MTGGRTLDRSRIERLMAAEMAAFERANPRSKALFERAQGSLLDGVPMNWMIKWAGPYPLFVEEARGAHFTDVDGHEYVDFCLGDTGAMAGPRPGRHDPRRRAPAPPRHHPHAADRGRDRRRRRAPAAVRPPVVAVHAHRHRREPLRDPARPPHHRPAEGARPQLLLPRLRRRDVRRRSDRTARSAPRHGNIGKPVALGRDDARRGVQRPRRAWSASSPTATSRSR